MLSRRDRDRLKVLHEVEKGHLKQRAASAQLKISERWVRELLRRVKEQGDGGVVHGLRGRVEGAPDSVGGLSDGSRTRFD